jgi:hypothetical protein
LLEEQERATHQRSRLEEMREAILAMCPERKEELEKHFPSENAHI